MRIEKSHGNLIVCEHVYRLDEIKIGSKWQGSSGHVTEIVDIKGEWIYYTRKDYIVDKDWFSFQCKYCLIIEEI